MKGYLKVRFGVWDEIQRACIGTQEVELTIRSFSGEGLG